jgi:hypothetical protein
VPIVLYAMDSYDFTDVVVTALNKTRGTSSTSDAPPASTPIAPTTTKPRKNN